MGRLRKALGWALRLIAGTLVFATLALAMVYGLLRSGVLTSSLDTIITTFARKEGVFFVRAEGVSGNVPEQLQVRKVEIGDSYGVWLTIEDAVATWEPFDLFHPFDANRWRIHIQDIHAGGLTWTRLPRRGPDEPDEPVDWNKFVRLVIDHLLVDELELSGDILGGGRALFQGEGAIVLGEWEHALVQVDLEHIDDVAGHARIDLTLGGSPIALEGRIEAEEGEGGALASLARLDEAGEVQLAVQAKGPLSDWHGEVDVTASSIGKLRVSTDLAFRADGPFEVRGTFDPVAAQRQRWLVGAGEEMTLAASGAWAPEVELRLDRVQLVADGRELLASGHLDLASLQFDLRADLEHRKEGEAVTTTLVDVASARLRAEGVLGDGGQLEATLDLDAPRAGQVSGRSLRASLRAEDDADDDDDGAPSFELTSHAEGLALDGAPLPLFGDKARLVAAGRVDLTAGNLRATEVVFEGGVVSARGPLSFRDRWGAMKGNLELEVGDLVSLTPVFRTSVAGRISAALDLAFSSEWKEFQAGLRANSMDVAIGEAGWNALLGGAATLSAQAKGKLDGPLDGQGSLSAAGIEASFDAKVGADGRDLSGGASFVLDNLSRLAEPGWAAVAGRLEGGVRVEGSLDRYDLDGSLRGDRFSWEGIRFDSLAADVEARDLPDQWSASVRGHGDYGPHEAHLSAQVAMPEAGHVVVENFSLRGPKSGADAVLDVLLPSATTWPLVSGTVKARSEDLSVWRAMTGLPLGGELDLDATFSVRAPGPDSPTGTQTVTGKALLRDAALPGEESELFVSELDVVATDLELGKRPGGQATVSATRVRYAGITLVEGKFSASGDGSRWEIDSRVDVRDGLSLRLDAGATVRPAAAWEIALRRAEGDLDGVAMHLRETLNLSLGDTVESDWSVSPLRLELGDKGLLEGEATRAKGRVRVKAEASALPLHLLSSFVPSLDLGGSLDGSLQLEGASQATLHGALSLRGHQVQGPGSDGQDRPLEVEAQAVFGKGRLRATAGLHGRQDTTFSVTLQAPLVAIAGESPFDAELLWKGELREILALFPVGDDTLRGRIDADLSLTGTLESPHVLGRARVEDGQWTNAATGLVLDDLRADLKGSGTELELVDLSATDGDEGRIRARGGIRFGTLPAFDAELDVEAVDAMLARLDLITARADASLAVRASRARAKGSPVGGSVTGSVKIDEARIEIPKGFTSDIPEIEVIEVGTDVSEAAAVAAQRGHLGLDIAIVADDRVLVTGRGLESEWSSDLRVGGSSRDPRLFGTISSVRGDLSLLGRRFDLTSAVLRFDGDQDNIPFLTMHATAEANDITAVAVVTGPATAPTVELRSEPALPRDEVLSRLLFGQSAADLTPMQSVQLARSVAELSGSPLGGGGGILGGIGRTLGFDRLDVESSGPDGSAALTASKYLTDNVYLRVQGGLTPEDSKLSLEWQVFQHITVESDVSQDAQGDVGVTWRWDY